MSTKIKTWASHIARVSSVAPPKRANVRPARRFEAAVSSPQDDKKALANDFLCVGQDIQKAMNQYGRQPKLTK